MGVLALYRQNLVLEQNRGVIRNGELHFGHGQGIARPDVGPGGECGVHQPDDLAPMAGVELERPVAHLGIEFRQ